MNNPFSARHRSSIVIQIYNNPETKYEEFKAFKLLTGWFEGQGWTVKRGVYDIETAFEAQFTVGEGGRTIAYNAEYGI